MYGLVKENLLGGSLINISKIMNGLFSLGKILIQLHKTEIYTINLQNNHFSPH